MSTRGFRPIAAMLASAFAALALPAAPARAAIGCDLNDPDSDVPRLVPGATR